MGVPHRCSKCRARRSLRRHIESYVNRPKCLSCGGDSLVLDKHRHEKELKKQKTSQCWCDGPLGDKGSYPHRPASTVWCIQHPTGPTDEQHIERYGYSMHAGG